MSIILSAQQQAVVDAVAHGEGNILVIARAGTGKTFTIRQARKHMVGDVAVCAYNKKIAAEVDSKLREDGNPADVGTFHSFGFKAIRKAFPRVKVEGKGRGCAGFYKFDAIADRLEVSKWMRGFVAKAMDLAMQSGFGVVAPLNDPASWLAMVERHDLLGELVDKNGRLPPGVDADQAVKTGCRLAAKAITLGLDMVPEVISYADMLYAPLALNMRMQQFPWVCTDEGQDTNPIRREMARRMVAPGGRMLWVGDDRQSIYGFTGADNDALQQIGEQFNCTILALTETRRCGKAIVELAKALVPDYSAHESNPDGIVRFIGEREFDTKEVLVPGEDAIICRNTAPLVRCAYSLIGRGVSAYVEGKSIGKGLLALLKKAARNARTVLDALDMLRDYSDAQGQRLRDAGQDAKAEALEDQIDCLLAIAATCPDHAPLDVLAADIDDLFQELPETGKPNAVVLLTAHRSKGLEFERVYGWGVSKFMPSRRAKQDWQKAQEANLEYVLKTRAIREYVQVDVS